MELEHIIPSDTLLSEEALGELEGNVDALIAVCEEDRGEADRLAFESVAALATEEGEKELFFTRKGAQGFLHCLSQSGGDLPKAMDGNLTAVQYAAQQLLGELAERKWMGLDLITALLERLDTVENQRTSNLIAFFRQYQRNLVQTVNHRERNGKLSNWANALGSQTVDGTGRTEPKDAEKIILLARGFWEITKGWWTTSDLLFLKTAMRLIGLSSSKKMSRFDLIKSVAGNDHLKRQLLGVWRIAYMPEGALLLLSGMKRLELFHTEESASLDWMMEELKSCGVQADREVLADAMTKKFLQRECLVDSDVPVRSFSLILELLLELRMARREGVLQTAGVIREPWMRLPWVLELSRKAAGERAKQNKSGYASGGYGLDLIDGPTQNHVD